MKKRKTSEKSPLKKLSFDTTCIVFSFLTINIVSEMNIPDEYLKRIINEQYLSMSIENRLSLFEFGPEYHCFFCDKELSSNFNCFNCKKYICSEEYNRFNCISRKCDSCHNLFCLYCSKFYVHEDTDESSYDPDPIYCERCDNNKEYAYRIIGIDTNGNKYSFLKKKGNG